MREGKKANAKTEDAKVAKRVSKKDSLKFGGPPYITRGQDKRGRMIDYIRHELCQGKGCNGCNGLGFQKQLVAL